MQFVTWVTLVTICYGLASVVVRSTLTSSQGLWCKPLPNLVCIICKGKIYTILYFMTPTKREHNLGVESVNWCISLNTPFFIPEYQTNWVYQVRFYQSCKFHDTCGLDSCVGTWPYKSWNEQGFLCQDVANLPL